MKRIFCLSVITMVIASQLHAQNITRISPTTITIRDVGFLQTVENSDFPNVKQNWLLWVGDSGVVVPPLPDTTILFRGAGGLPIWTNYRLDPSVTFYAVSYFDTLHAIIGGSGGAVYYTNDAAHHWQRSDLGTTAAIRGLAYNRNGVHLAVGDSGLIFRSTDSGATWQRNAIPGANTFNSVYFGSENTAIVAGEDSSIFKSIDGGVSWIRVAKLEPILNSLTQIGSSLKWSSVAMSGPDTVIITLERPEVVLFSYDGMNSFDTAWLNPSPKAGPLHKVVYCGLNISPDTHITAIAVGEDDLLHVLVPGKDFHNWQSGGPYYISGDADGGSDVFPLRLTCASYDASDTNVAFGGDNANLSIPSNFITSGLASDKFAPTPFWLPGIDSSAVDSLTSSPVPLSWPEKLVGEDWLDVMVRPSGKGCSVLTGGVLLLTSDNGLEWYQSPLTTNYPINTALMLNDSLCIGIGYNGSIYRTNAHGTGFDQIASGTTERLHGIAFPSLDDGIIVGDNGYIIRSTDTGKSWAPYTPTPAEYLRGVAFVNDTIGVAVGDGATILRTTDGGLSWNNENNILTGSGYSISQVQAFGDGIFLARANVELIRSKDFGLDWESILPGGLSDSLGMSFYTPQIGIIAERETSSALVPDTAFFSYTMDSAKTWKSFSIPIFNYNRVVFQWLNDHEVLLYGILCNEYLVDFSTSGVQVTHVNDNSALQVFPNPSSGQVSVDYITKTNGPVFIELWDESGKQIQQLFSGAESAGSHQQSFTLPQDIHGTFFIQISADGETSTVPISVE